MRNSLIPSSLGEGGGGRGGGSLPTKPDTFQGGVAGERLCYLSETPAELMVDYVIFVDCILKYNLVPMGLNEMWA